jgi:glycosyltransferase domain-containing protein
MSAAALAPRLTIVLPLRGRHLFTLRFLWYANEMRLPYRFMIADGQVNASIARHIENSRETFPHLDIEYVRYPDDISYSRFFAKMSDAVSRVRTPYTMLADNDDFLGVDGIEQALDFLEVNPDYVCACGRSALFKVYSKLGTSDGAVHGRLNGLYIVPNRNDIDQASATERLREGGLFHLVYYSVYRTEALVAIWREANEIDFSDLVLHENFHALRTLALGKVRANCASITRYAQLLTSLSSNPSRDWVRHLLHSRFTSEVHAVVKRVSMAAAEADGINAVSVAEIIRGLIEACLREFLLMNYGWLMTLKRSMRRKWPCLVRYIQTRPRFFIGRKRSALLSQLARSGASQERLRRTQSELAAIEVAISPKAFATFASPFVQMARADLERTWF